MRARYGDDPGLRGLNRLLEERVGAAKDPRQALADLLERADLGEVLDWIPEYESPAVLVEQTVQTLDRRNRIDENLFRGLLAEDSDGAGDKLPVAVDEWQWEMRGVARSLGVEPEKEFEPPMEPEAEETLDLDTAEAFAFAEEADPGPAPGEAPAPEQARDEGAVLGEEPGEMAWGEEARDSEAAAADDGAEEVADQEEAEAVGIGAKGESPESSGPQPAGALSDPSTTATSRTDSSGVRETVIRPKRVRPGTGTSAPGAKRREDPSAADIRGHASRLPAPVLRRLLSLCDALVDLRSRSPRRDQSKTAIGVLVTPDLLLAPGGMARRAERGASLQVRFRQRTSGRDSTTVAEPVWSSESRGGLAVLRLGEQWSGSLPPLAHRPPLAAEPLSAVFLPGAGAAEAALGAFRVEGAKRSHLLLSTASGGRLPPGAVADPSGIWVALYPRSRGEEYGPASERLEAPLVADFLRDCRHHAPAIWAEIVGYHPELRMLDPRLERYLKGEPSRELLSLSVEILPGADADLSQVPDLQVVTRGGGSVAALGSHRSVRALWHQVPQVVALRLGDDRGRQETAVSLPFIGATEAHSAPPPKRERGGRALVGIIDDGIDVLHDAFRGDAGTRIRFFLDARHAGPPGPFSAAGQTLWNALGLESGRLYVAADLDGFRRDGAVPVDFPGDVAHGTAVASIAAGRASGDFAGGVAPDAPLAVVRYHDRIGFMDSIEAALRVLEGYASAPEVGLPLVVNLSVGTNAGPHDGRSPLEVACDAFSSRPGRVLVKSAGNQAKSQRHATVAVARNEKKMLDFKVPAGEASVRMELWFPAGHRYELQVESPAPSRSDLYDTALLDGFPDEAKLNGKEMLFLSCQASHPTNGDGYVLLELRAGTGQTEIQHGDWRLLLEGVEVFDPKGEIHAWLEIHGATKFAEGEKLCTLTTPGTTRGVITVGARNCDTTRQLEPSSSYGPTRDGNPKPDLCAPGTSVRVAMAGLRDGSEIRSGTSFAAPHVTGSVALLLSANRRAGHEDLTHHQVLSLIRTRGVIEGPGVHNEQAGFGSLSVAALLRARGFLD